MFLGVRKLISCHWCFEVEVANVKTCILCTVSGNSAIDMELGSRQVVCRCTKVDFSHDSVSTVGNLDSVHFYLLETDIADGPKVCRGDMLGLCFPLDEESGSSAFDSAVALGELTPLI